MTYNGYVLDLLIAGESTMEGGSQKSFNLSIGESINDFLPFGSVTMKDSSGVSLEKLVATQGIPMEVVLGTSDSTVSLDGISGDIVSSGYNASGIIQGDLLFDVWHKEIANQDSLSTAYKGTTSDVIKDVLSANFSNFDIDPSGGFSTYYGTHRRAFDIVSRYLAPKLYSPLSNDSPYYVWVDLDSQVHIKNKKSLMDQTPVDTINIRRMHTQEKLTNIAMDVSYVSVDFLENVKKFTVSKHAFNLETGDLETVQRSCLENNPKPLKKHPSMFTTPSRGLTDTVKAPVTTGEKEIFLGVQINSQKTLTKMQMLTITITLSPHIRAGNTINITSLSYKRDGSNSVTFSGKYLVERVLHIHNGIAEDPIVYTKLLVSRDSLSLPLSEGYGLAPDLGSFIL